jgi:hypothetical protein
LSYVLRKSETSVCFGLFLVCPLQFKCILFTDSLTYMISQSADTAYLATASQATGLGKKIGQRKLPAQAPKIVQANRTQKSLAGEVSTGVAIAHEDARYTSLRRQAAL